jgi:hypothetical protein
MRAKRIESSTLPWVPPSIGTRSHKSDAALSWETTWWLLAVTILFRFGGCGYGATFLDCEVSCSAAGGCPSTFTCGTDRLCRASGATASCTAVLGDAGTRDGPPPAIDGKSVDAAPVDVTLSENGSTTNEFGDPPCENTGSVSVTMSAYFWYQAFALADFAADYPGITNGFHVTTVHLATYEAGAATATVTLSSYTGTVGSATLDTSAMTTIQTTTTQEISGTIQDNPVSITGDIGANDAFVVKVFAEVPQGDGFLGANSGPETRPTYYTSSCSSSSSGGVPESSYSYLISVEGTYMP